VLEKLANESSQHQAVHGGSNSFLEDTVVVVIKDFDLTNHTEDLRVS
jgi:hypothetical protein